MRAALIAALSLAVPAGGSFGGPDHPGPVAVIAVVDDAFSPYHLDFAADMHPWNVDGDPSNDIDLRADPSTFIEGYPGSTPIEITVPEWEGQPVSSYRVGLDAHAWAAFEASSPGDVRLYRFPGTTIIGAVRFGDEFYGPNDAHGTRSAASAVGSIHGTCPECLVVLVRDTSGAGLAWAAAQPWIDVVTNSYGNSAIGIGVRDNLYFGAPLEATRAASEAGRTIVFSAGNGFLNRNDVPQLTYWSSEKGPDWIITVGSVTSGDEQPYTGSGKPVDVSSIGGAYPSTGGATAGGSGTHSGTSNAAPVVAGYIGAAIVDARALLADTTSGVIDGIVARGEPVLCGDAEPRCPLGDGVLTSLELHRAVLLAAPRSSRIVIRAPQTTIPPTTHAYYYRGHGVYSGIANGRDDHLSERRAIADLMRGVIAPPELPQRESDWWIADSFCRQRLWGSWGNGYYRDGVPSSDPVDAPLAASFLAWCSGLPERALAGLAGS